MKARYRLFLLAFLLFCLPLQSSARLGGGSSFSSGRSSSSSRSYSAPRSSGSSGWGSGSSSGYHSSGGYYSSGGYSSGGSSGDGDAIIALIVVVVMLVLFVLFLAWMASMATAVGRYFVPAGRGPPQTSNAPPVYNKAYSAAVDPLALVREHDANFSEPVFQAFLHLLFSRFHNERGAQNLAVLDAYFDERVLHSATRGQRVSDVLVGASRYLPLLSRADVPNGFDALNIEFEATFAEGSREFYTIEQWTLARKRGVLSKDPEAMLNLGCPSCGNPSQLDKNGKCPYCDQVVNRGDFQWKVVKRMVGRLEAKPAMQMDAPGEEIGNDYETVFQPDFAIQRKAFLSRHPGFSWDELRERMVAIFLNLQEAWSTLQFEKARPFETDVLYDTHLYWIDRYRSQGLQNKLENVKVTQVVPCRMEQDAFYERITVRIFASMLDYVVDKQNHVVSGDPRTPRAFSEYWTFLRRIGAKSEKAQSDLSSCPHCGAPMQVSQAGICEHCGAKVASGNFDWVLASIEQDEAYAPNSA